jgi:FkbM family methyltransferase
MTVSDHPRRVLFLALAGVALVLAVVVLARVLVSSAPGALVPEPKPAKPQSWPPPYSKKQLVYPAASEPGRECDRLFATPFGTFWGAEAQRYDLEMVVREQSPGSAHLYERDAVVIHRGDVVMDGGAHLGVFTRLALWRGAKRVIAFEPQADIIACLERTFAPEIASGQVTLVAKAIWRQAGTLEFAGSGQSFHARGSQPGQPAGADVVRMPATTIDETVEALGLDRVDFIKMDIEGAEREALLGASRTIALFKPALVVCAYHRPDDAQAIPAAVGEIRKDYDVFPKIRGPQDLLIWFH